jgi:hypothetical protein
MLNLNLMCRRIPPRGPHSQHYAVSGLIQNTCNPSGGAWSKLQCQNRPPALDTAEHPHPCHPHIIKVSFRLLPSLHITRATTPPNIGSSDV